MTDLTELHQRATRLARMNQPRAYREYAAIDWGSRDSTYIQFSRADATTLIFDVTGCSYVATAPNADNTLTVIKDGEEIRLESL